MKIGLLSDVHSRFGHKIPDTPNDLDLLVLAGDIGDPYAIRDIINDDIDVSCAYIAGNHEAYGYSFEEISSEIFNNTSECYNRYTLNLERDVHLCTLWTDLKGPLGEIQYRETISDMLPQCIHGWTIEKYKREFKSDLDFLYDVVKEGDVIATHHAPTWQAVSPEWKTASNNMCFVTDLDRFILDRKPSVWMFGHVHTAFDFMIGETRMVCNPGGYKYERAYMPEHKVKIIEV